MLVAASVRMRRISICACAPHNNLRMRTLESGAVSAGVLGADRVAGHLSQASVTIPGSVDEVPQVAVVGPHVQYGVPESGAGLGLYRAGGRSTIGQSEGEIIHISGYRGGVGACDNVPVHISQIIQAFLSAGQLGTARCCGFGAQGITLPCPELVDQPVLYILTGVRNLPLD